MNCVGGVISPCLLNVALHGMEHAAGVRYRNSARSDAETIRGCPVLVRYADDYVAMCYSREQAEQVQARLAAWLEPRGLRFNQDKTRIVHVEDGFSFLGFDIRRHVDRQGSGKLLITPGKEQVKRLRKRLTAEVRALRGANAAAVIARLAPIIRGWSAYYRIGVSARVFTGLDHHVWDSPGWARHSHPNKPRGWVTTRYFGMFNTARQDRWVFGDRNTGVYLPKFAWTKIVRHVPVHGGASPDDPALTRYWADRRRKREPPPADQHAVRLWRAARRPLSRLRGTAPARQPRAAHPIGMGAVVQHRTADAPQAARHRAGRSAGPDGSGVSFTHPATAAHAARQATSMKRMQARRRGACLSRGARKAGTPGS